MVLEPDHIKPKSKGGNDGVDNLLTACFACNRGKGAAELSVIPDTLAKKAGVIAAQEAQIKAYNRRLTGRMRRLKRDVGLIEKAFQETYPKHAFLAPAKDSIIMCFLPHLHYEEMQQFMRKACFRTRSADDAYRYFCGICWKVIRERALST